MCVCNYETPSVYWKTIRKARKTHRCEECGTFIHPATRYEHVRGVWEGEPRSYKTCLDCVAARELLDSCESCFCWSHGGLWDDVDNLVREIDVPAIRFGVWRLVAKMKRRRRTAWEERRAA